MSMRETAAYIAGRIRMAGGDAARLFTREAVAEIFDRSHGIPRLVNVICDNALVSGFALSARPVSRQTVMQVCHDFDFSSGRVVKGTVSEEQTVAAAEQSLRARTPEAAPQADTPPVSPAETMTNSTRSDRHRFSLFDGLRRGSR